MEDYGFNLILYVIKSTVFSLGVSHLFNIVFDISMRKYSISIALIVMMDVFEVGQYDILVEKSEYEGEQMRLQ